MTATDPTGTAKAWHRVPPWRPSPELRHVRHGINNLLAPLSVAVDLAADVLGTADPALASMAARSIASVVRANERMGRLLRRAPLTLTTVPVSSLTTHTTTDGREARVDTARFAELVAELAANAAEVTVTVDGDDLVVISRVQRRPFTVDEAERLAVPFAVGVVGLAIVCAVADDHAGHVRVNLVDATLEARIPLNAH